MDVEGASVVKGMPRKEQEREREQGEYRTLLAQYLGTGSCAFEAGSDGRDRVAKLVVLAVTRSASNRADHRSAPRWRDI